MSRVPTRSTQEVERLLRHFGLHRIRHGSGHDIWGPAAGIMPVVVPRARRRGEMESGTVRSILRAAGITVADALAFWGVRER